MRTSDWYVKRLIACEGYPASEALYTSVEDYVEQMEELHNAEMGISDRSNERLRAEVAEKTRLLADKDGDIIDLQIERDRLREIIKTAAVRAATIEECAKVCIQVGAEHPNHAASTIRAVSKWCAAAIRALKEGS